MLIPAASLPVLWRILARYSKLMVPFDLQWGLEQEAVYVLLDFGAAGNRPDSTILWSTGEPGNLLPGLKCAFLTVLPCPVSTAQIRRPVGCLHLISVHSTSPTAIQLCYRPPWGGATAQDLTVCPGPGGRGGHEHVCT